MTSRGDGPAFVVRTFIRKMATLYRRAAAFLLEAGVEQQVRNRHLKGRIQRKNMFKGRYLPHSYMILQNKQKTTTHKCCLNEKIILSGQLLKASLRVSTLSLTVDMLSNVTSSLTTLQRADCWAWWSLQKDMREF